MRRYAAIILFLMLASRGLGQRPKISRLPPVDGDVRRTAMTSDDRDFVILAGGAVELRAPMKWQVREVPFGREMRLVLAPKLPNLDRQMPTDGIYITCHVKSGPRPQADMDRQLQQFLQSRTPGSDPTWQIKTLSWERLQLSKRAAMRRSFSATAAKKQYRGMHVAVNAPWGICEIVAITPATGFGRRLVDFRQTLATLKLNPARPLRQRAVRTVEPAQAILGSWKAFRSRLKLYPNGHIDIITDRPIRLTRFDGKQVRPKRLRGKYRAQGDLIYVTWSDGSRLNFRWRLRGDVLLLTDHEGQISQLRKILD